MKTLLQSVLEKDLKRFIGKGTKLKFINDKNWYLFKNFSSDFKSVFVVLVGERVYFKKISDIIEIWNGQLFKIESSITEKEELASKEDQIKRGSEIESEHLPTYNKIKEYYNKHNKLPNKEEFFKWISEDHIEEFTEDDYYKALEEMENELKNKVITEEVELRLEANEEEAIPEFTDAEKKEEVITSRQTIENIIAEIEAALLDEQNVLIPPRVNYITRLNNVLTALKTLRNDLDVFSKIVQENRDFKKEDIKLILETNYKIIDKNTDFLYKISTRNTFKENSRDIFNYNLEVFFDDNCLEVTPTILSESSKKLANKVLYEIYEDLAAIKSNDEIISEEIEENPIESENEENIQKNKYFNDVVTQYFFGEDRGIEFLDKIVEKADEDDFEDDEQIETTVDFYLTTKPVSEYGFDAVLINVNYSFYNRLEKSEGDELTPTFYNSYRDNEKVELGEIYVNGDIISLNKENQELLNKIDWANKID